MWIIFSEMNQLRAKLSPWKTKNSRSLKKIICYQGREWLCSLRCPLVLSNWKQSFASKGHQKVKVSCYFNHHLLINARITKEMDRVTINENTYKGTPISPLDGWHRTKLFILKNLTSLPLVGIWQFWLLSVYSEVLD